MSACDLTYEGYKQILEKAIVISIFEWEIARANFGDAMTLEWAVPGRHDSGSSAATASF